MLGEMAATGNFSFRGLTREFNKLLYLYLIRVPSGSRRHPRASHAGEHLFDAGSHLNFLRPRPYVKAAC